MLNITAAIGLLSDLLILAGIPLNGINTRCAADRINSIVVGVFLPEMNLSAFDFPKSRKNMEMECGIMKG